MATVGEVAALLGVGPTTVREWGVEFKENLSPTAVPDKGQVRNFTDEDLRVLALVAKMRAEQATYDGIREALDNGDRAMPPPPTEDAGPSTALAIRYERELSRMSGQLVSVEAERDRVIQERDAEREKRIEAEKRASVAEARLSDVERATRAEATLEAYQVMHPIQPPTEAPSVPVSPTIEVQAGAPHSVRVEPRKSWWDRLRGR